MMAPAAAPCKFWKHGAHPCSAGAHSPRLGAPGHYGDEGPAAAALPAAPDGGRSP